jgi:hypothetical protein
VSLIEDPKEFWSQWCPERGAALTHAHWNRCDPARNHPGTSDTHTYIQCCHCGQTSVAWAAEQTRLAFAEASEPVNVQAPLVPPAAVVDLEYDREDEPALAQGVYPGPSWGEGRGIIGFVLQGRLNMVAYIERTRGYR